MFDLRYHVASLAAVFLALIIGIVVGVGISGRGLVDESERRNLNEQIERLRGRLEAEEARGAEREAATAFVESTYEPVMHNRLLGRRIAVVFIGSVDRPGVAHAIEEALADAGAELTRLRAIDVPIRAEALLSAAGRVPDAGEAFRDGGDLTDLGEALGDELVAGGETPLWDALTQHLVEERSGSSEVPADGVVVAQTAEPASAEAEGEGEGEGEAEEEPEADDTQQFLFGFLVGLADTVPAVGVESSARLESGALDSFGRAGLSTVAGVETAIGRVALAVLLAGGQTGHYGLGPDVDAVLPPVEPVTPPRDGG